MLATVLLCRVVMSTPACPPTSDSIQPYCPQLAYSSEWRASTFSRSAQAEAAIDVDREGNITTAWSSRRQQEGRSGVYLQRFSSQGVAIGSETQVNLWPLTHAISPAAGCSINGLTWVVWQSHGQDGHGASIIARRFDPSHSDQADDLPLKTSPEILVNQDWLGDQVSPVVAVANDGAALVAWTSTEDSTGRGHVKARLFDETGQSIGDEFTVASADHPADSSPSAVWAIDGTFAIAFAVSDEFMHPAGIRVQRFDACGHRLSSSTIANGSAIEPVIAATKSGYVLAWLELRDDGADYAIVAQRLDAHGHPNSASFLASPEVKGPQSGAALAVASDDRLAISWNGNDGDETGIFCQLFADNGNRIGSAFRINRHSKGQQSARIASGTQRLVFGPHDQLLCGWNGDGGLGDDSAVHLSMHSPRQLDLNGAVQGVTPQITAALSPLESDIDAMPHEPPTFDPRDIDEGRREIHQGLVDIGFTGIFNTGWTPPDPHMGVGPSHLVVMTNGAIAAFDKTGQLQFQELIEGPTGFWGSLGATNFVFDPEVLYDDMSGRFFAMASEANAPGGKSFILIAVSDDSDPNGTWHKSRIETTALAGTTYDSPNIGVDANVVYITGDKTNGAPAYPVYTFDKPSLLAGQPPAITRSALMPTATLSAGIPPVSYDNPPALYLIEHKEAPSNTSVRLIALTDPLGTPTFTFFTLPVATYGPPEDPPQSGTAFRPETFDTRFWSVAYRNGSLWATHHINNTRVLARWYEIAMNGWPTSGQTPALVQSGTIDPGPTIRTFFSAITVDDSNNAAIVFARSSPSEFISMQTVYREHDDPLNTFQAPVTWQNNTGPYANNRWGDYAAVNVDPSDGQTIWAHHEYAVGSAWRTWIQSFTPPAPFCPADVDSTGVVDVDDLLLVINAWGTAGGPADITGDGTVDVDDLLAAINAWGPCS